MVVALVVGLLIGRVIRRRDEQVARERVEHGFLDGPAPRIPTQGTRARPAGGGRNGNGSAAGL